MTSFHKKVDKSIDDEFEKRTGSKIIRLKVVLKISKRVLLKGLFSTIDKLNPDIVFMHGIGDLKDLQLWLSKPSYILVRDCHMSWVASKNKFRHLYYLLFRIFFSRIINESEKYKVIYALGIEEYEYLKHLGLKDKKIDFLKHGYNSEIMRYDYKSRKSIRHSYSVNDNEVLISYIVKLNDNKRPDIIFDIIDNLGETFIKEYSVTLLFIGRSEQEYFEKLLEKKRKLRRI
ncbi:hypothetical protein ACTQ5J_07055 [Fundicoccus sp. Sow4_F4]|uniref:hypothetical protein n=1 Tax=Fundicoccus sp. Sow4_F4 TaxID=3438783 RepID=UPI003F92F70F